MSEAMEHKDHGRLIVSSKGLATKGIALIMGKDENGRETIYTRVAAHFNIRGRVEDYFKEELAGMYTLSSFIIIVMSPESSSFAHRPEICVCPWGGLWCWCAGSDVRSQGK